MGSFRGFGFRGGSGKVNSSQNQEDKESAYRLWCETGIISHLKRAAELGHLQAQDDLAFKYYVGEGVEQSYERAFHWTERGTQQNSLVAWYNLGFMYMNGYFVPQNFEKAEECYRRAAGLGHKDAEAWLRMLPGIKEYHLWKSTEDISHLKKAAELGCADAQNDLSIKYYTGGDVEKSYEQAFYWSERAAQQNNAASWYNMGFMYMYGYGVDLNFARAEECFQKALELGSPMGEEGLKKLESCKDNNLPIMNEEIYRQAKEGDALSQNLLGSFYKIKVGDYENAEKWWLTAGENGDCGAYESLGYHYLEKEPNDEEQAKKYFRMAADLRELDVVVEIAAESLDSQDYEEHIRGYGYCESAVERGNADAYWMMGKIHELGHCGKEKDLVKALEYYRKSYDAGREETEEDLDNLEALVGVKNLDRLEEKKETEVKEPRERKELPENLDSYFEGLIGMDSVKEQLNKIYHSVKINIMRNRILEEKGEKPVWDESGYNFIILGNPGTGKTMVARIIARILRDIQIRESDTFLEVDRSKMLSEHIGGTEKKMRSIFRRVEGGTLFIDEAHNLYKEGADNDFGQEAIDTLLKEMEDNRDSFSVIMAGYKEPLLDMMKNANSGFRSRFSYLIELPDYTEEELILIAHKHMQNLQYEPEEGVDEAIRKCISRDKIDDTFGNARYIRELVKQSIENQAQRLHEKNDFQEGELFSLKAEDFWTGELEEKSTAEYLEELDALVGLKQVKEEVRTLIDRITLQTELEKRGMKSTSDLGTLHMAFKGNPGTGKTTVARLLGNLYSSMGILKRKGVFVECTRATLIGQYQGHTAANVKKAVQSALGGILFIDEAYALVKGDGDSFGKEALDTLVAEMENYRDKLIVIFAGYSRDMDEFFENNQGLRSRVPMDLFFEDYNQEEMLQIALTMLSAQGYEMEGADAEKALEDVIAQVSGEKGFGNARGIRNLTDSIKRRQNGRIVKLLQEQGESVGDSVLMQVLEADIR